MNNNKICFITCVKDDILYNENVKYIENLNIPEGYEIEFKGVKGAKSITSGYNEAMKSSDAKYKVYLHQDTYIINKHFIYDILSIFNDDDKIGMLGVIGAKTIPSDAIWMESTRNYGRVYESRTGKMELLEFKDVEKAYEVVKAIDGLIIVTQYDLLWREDVFDGWDFYDVSQSIEFTIREYKVVIPKQEKPWCIHDCGLVNSKSNYELYRKKFLEQYSKHIIDILNYEVINDKYADEDEIIEWINYYKHNFKNDNKVHFLEEYLINKYGLEEKEKSELFNFDKIKGLEIVNLNRKEFYKYLYKAKYNLDNKNYEQASRWCYQAAVFATDNHPGFYVSKELEDILIECANNLPEVKKNIDVEKRDTNKRRILHVLSEGYAVGGHTRLVKNWIEKDKTSEHSLITTWQMKTAPTWLLDEVKSSGGWCYSLENIDNFIDRAAALRKIAYEYADVVVLHIHMYDSIPAMAFGIAGGPPILFMNHGDHVFWIGVSIIDRLINYREAGQYLSMKRRNINRNLILPLPLSLPKESTMHQEERKTIGIEENTVVLLSIATEYKFTSFGKIHYLDIMKEIIKNNPNTMLMVIGPGNSGVWEDAYNETQGRILPLGIKEDIESYYAIADIYIDSYMIGSNTSALDAALRGLPVVSLKNSNNLTLSFNDISYNEGLNNIYDLLKYTDELVNNKELRKETGLLLSNKIKENHIYNWNEYLDKVYNTIEDSQHCIYSLDNISKNKIENNDLFLALFQKKVSK